MAEIRATLNLEQDGSSLPDNPTVRRFNLLETSGEVNLTYAPDGNTTSFHPVAQASMPSINVVYVASDQALNVQLNNSATAIPIQAGGYLFQMGTAITQIAINNPSANASANVVMFFAGS